jgi:GNAT superfamily N-acetyltransferase
MMRIVPATLQDLEELVPIQASLDVEGRLYSLPAYIRSAINDIYIARDETIYGSMELAYLPGTLRVSTIAVRPDMRRKGIGTALMRFAEGLARKEGMPLSCGTTDKYDSYGFIVAQGFTLTDKRGGHYEFIKV